MNFWQKSESGQVSLLIAIIMVSVFGLSIIFTKQTIQNNREILNKVKSYYCIYQYQKNIKKHVQYIENLNLIIKSTNILSKVALMIPGLNITSLSAQQAKKILKSMQYISLVSFQKNTVSQIKNHCPIPPNGVISPYSTLGFKINRDILEAAKVGSKKWTRVFYLDSKNIITIKYSIRGSSLKTVSRIL